MKKISLFVLAFLTLQTVFAQKSIMDFYNARVQELQTNLGNKTVKPTIKVKDEANGYISYDLNSMTITGYEEMAYFIASSGKKIIAIAKFDCGPLCGANLPEFFELKNGKLENVTETYFDIPTGTQADAWIIEKREQLEAKLGSVPISTWVKVPRIGTTIQMGLMAGADETGTFYNVCELQFNKATGKFKLVKK